MKAEAAGVAAAVDPIRKADGVRTLQKVGRTRHEPAVATRAAEGVAGRGALVAEAAATSRHRCRVSPPEATLRTAMWRAVRHEAADVHTGILWSATLGVRVL